MTRKRAKVDALQGLALEGLAACLERRKLPFRVAGDFIKLQFEPAQIRVHDVALSQHSETHIANLSVDFVLNPEFSESFIGDCTMGFGDSPRAAIDDAAEVWTTMTAPPVFSLLHCKPVMAAEWLPDDSTYGIAGWNIFSGPYVVRGAAEASALLQSHLEKNPPLPALESGVKGASLRPNLNFVRIFWGFDGTDPHAECRVNGVSREMATRQLSRLDWPVLDGFATMGQFHLLMR